MDNMTIYNAHRKAPNEALKPISAGRLKGMTDINPMWRIKALTEQFGPCGVGWYYTTDKQWFEQCGQETVAFVNISLYIKVDNEWSKPISGTGGSKLGVMEKNGLYVSDEALKMATTDAISVACKQLGFAADIYWQNDRTKYNAAPQEAKAEQAQPAKKETAKPQAVAGGVDPDLLPCGKGVTESRLMKLKAEMERTGVPENTILGTARAKTLVDMNEATYIAIMNKLARTATKS